MNNFRGIVILMVILVHSVSSIPDASSFYINMLRVHLDNSTILFVAIAGYFFTILSAGYDYFPFLKNKFKAVIVPYLFISIPAVLLYILKIKPYHGWIDLEWFHGSLNPVEQYLYLIFTGAHLGPLWFVPMIILFYVFSPLFILIQKRQGLFIAFFVSLIFGMYWGRPAFNSNALHSFVFFLPAYFLGMLLVEKKYLYESIVKNSGIFLFLYIAIASIIYMTVEVNSSIDLVIKLVLTLVLLAFCKRYINYKVIWLDLFARLSFFLFFIHGYFTGMVRLTLRQTDIQLNEYVALFCIFPFIIFMSLLTYIVAKLALKKRARVLIGA